MSIADAAGWALPDLRREADALMLDACRAMRPTGGWVVVDGKEVQAADELFESRCKVQTRDAIAAAESEVGGRTAVTVRTEVHLPASTDALEVGDLIEFTAVHPLSFAKVGQRVRVTGPVAGTLKTARRYVVEEVVS